MKKNILVLVAVIAVVLCSCEKGSMHSYILRNDLTDSLTIKKVGDYGYLEYWVAANEYEQSADIVGPMEKVFFYDLPEKCNVFLFTYKGKTYREDRRGGYSALNSAVYGKPTHIEPQLQSMIDYILVFNITEEYLATLPEVTD